MHSIETRVLYTQVPDCNCFSSLPIRTFGLVEIRLRLTAKSPVLVSDTVDAADLEKLRADSRYSVEDIERIIPLLKLKKATIKAAEV